MAEAICKMPTPAVLYDPKIGRGRVVQPGDRLPPDAEIVKFNDWAFEIPVVKRAKKADVEAATAAPGEKRALSK